MDMQDAAQPRSYAVCIPRALPPARSPGALTVKLRNHREQPSNSVDSVFGRCDVLGGGGARIVKKRDEVSALMALTVAWNMLGFASGFFHRAWRDAPLPVARLSYALNVALALFSPVARNQGRWPALLSSVLGVTMAIWSVAGLFTMSHRKTKLAPGVPGIAGPSVAALLGALTALLGRAAYKEWLTESLEEGRPWWRRRR